MSNHVATPNEKSASEPPELPQTILIVDDDPLGREVVATLLRTQGYQVAFADSGPAALQQAAALRPDLIVLDVMMPDMDGFEVCRRLRSDRVLGEVAVIMLTALDDRDSRIRGLEAGADDVMPKPFDRLELRARVNTIMRLKRHRRLLTERDKLARVIEFAPDGLLIVSQAGLIMLANPAIAGLLGRGQHTDLIGQPLLAVLGPRQGAICQAALAQVGQASSAPVRVELLLPRSGAARVPIEMRIGFLWWDGQPAAQIIARDITERKQAELLEEERRQIAYELHDGLAQMVISVHQHLQAFAARHRPRTQATRAELDRILDLARRSVTEIRRVIGGLRPTALDDFGLAVALHMNITALRADGWEIRYRETLGAERLTPTIETVLYRVAQEALANIRKHAQTNRAAVALERGEHALRLTIQDWGCGFDPARVLGRSGFGERIGLRGMYERVALVGGEWHIHSSPGAGVLIVAEIPLPQEIDQ